MTVSHSTESTTNLGERVRNLGRSLIEKHQDQGSPGSLGVTKLLGRGNVLFQINRYWLPRCVYVAKFYQAGDFPGGPGAKTPCSQCRAPGQDASCCN